MKFSKEFLQEMNGETIEDVITGHSRWSVAHRRVFKHDGKYYETCYSVGATEYQNQSPYEYGEAEIECIEVFPAVKAVTVFEPKL